MLNSKIIDMNKILKYVMMSSVVIASFSCSDDLLETNPTDKTTKDIVFSDVASAYSSINGIYRTWYKYDVFTTGYEAENFGIKSMHLAYDLMGDDMVQHEAGSAWFWYDYKYWVKTEVTSTRDRPYVWWNTFYKLINNANYIIANIDNAAGDDKDRNNIKGQALAIRAYSYFELIQNYQRTYIGHENDPGVPLYNEPSIKTTEGKGRGTVEQVYKQINDDLAAAILLLEDATPQIHKSHIDQYVANGILARVKLVQNKWADAKAAATKAVANSATKLLSKDELLSGFNSVTAGGWMWGAEINEAQATSWNSFFNHMDSGVSSYAARSRKCISKWLYDQIGANDIRKNWFGGAIASADEESLGTKVSYIQQKFKVKSKGSWSADYIYMRVAEMYLIIAETECRLGNDAAARIALKNVVEYKDADLVALIDGKSGKTLNLQSADGRTSLLDEILLQRRIELWGEGFRIRDIVRNKTGFSRNYIGSNHSSKNVKLDPESWDWVMLIPQREFDGNSNMDPVKDQNE